MRKFWAPFWEFKNQYIILCRVSYTCIHYKLSAAISDKYHWPYFTRSLGLVSYVMLWINKLMANFTTNWSVWLYTPQGGVSWCTCSQVQLATLAYSINMWMQCHVLRRAHPLMSKRWFSLHKAQRNLKSVAMSVYWAWSATSHWRSPHMFYIKCSGWGTARYRCQLFLGRSVWIILMSVFSTLMPHQ